MISVIIPVFNGRLYLRDAIESVLAQTYRNWELIVVDDGSTDGSAQVAHEFGSTLRYSYQTHRGLAGARNHGVELSKGSYLAFLDADDIWVPDRLSLQMNAFADQPDLEAVFGQVKQFVSPELSEEEKSRLHCPPESVPGYLAGAWLIRREAFLRVGFFSTELEQGEFVDWIARSREAGLKQLMLPDLVLHRRLHLDNMGRRNRPVYTDYARILKASLDRRRSSRNDPPETAGPIGGDLQSND